MLLLFKVIGNIGLVVRCVGLSFLKEEICVYDSLEDRRLTLEYFKTCHFFSNLSVQP